MIKIDYKNSLINLTASLLNHYNCFPEYKTLHNIDEYLKRDYNHVILIVLDGLGVNIINNNLTEEQLLRQNIKQTISSVFPPTTVAATNAILSGKPPFASGYVGWAQYNKYEDAHVIVFKNEDYYNHKNILSTNLKEEMLSYENMLEKIKHKNNDLHVELLFPSFHEKGYETFDDQLNRLLMITKKKKSFSYCYFDEPDITVHKSGISGTRTKRIVNKLNESYERFLKEISDDVLVILTADHGLIDVEPVELYKFNDLKNTFRKKPSLESRALTFFIKEEEKDLFEELFDKYFQPGFLLLTKEELYETELLGYGVKHQYLDSFIGDYVAISTSNKMIQLKKGKPFKAHHAGLTKEELEVPIIVNK